MTLEFNITKHARVPKNRNKKRQIVGRFSAFYNLLEVNGFY